MVMDKRRKEMVHTRFMRDATKFWGGWKHDVELWLSSFQALSKLPAFLKIQRGVPLFLFKGGLRISLQAL